MSDHAPGAGPGIRKTIPRKRLKAAHRKYRAAGGVKTLREWALNGSNERRDLALQWLANKKVTRKQ